MSDSVSRATRPTAGRATKGTPWLWNSHFHLSSKSKTLGLMLAEAGMVYRTIPVTYLAAPSTYVFVLLQHKVLLCSTTPATQTQNSAQDGGGQPSHPSRKSAPSRIFLLGHRPQEARAPGSPGGLSPVSWSNDPGRKLSFRSSCWG